MHKLAMALFKRDGVPKKQPNKVGMTLQYLYGLPSLHVTLSPLDIHYGMNVDHEPSNIEVHTMNSYQLTIIVSDGDTCRRCLQLDLLRILILCNSTHYTDIAMGGQHLQEYPRSLIGSRIDS